MAESGADVDGHDLKVERETILCSGHGWLQFDSASYGLVASAVRLRRSHHPEGDRMVNWKVLTGLTFVIAVAGAQLLGSGQDGAGMLTSQGP